MGHGQREERCDRQAQELQVGPRLQRAGALVQQLLADLQGELAVETVQHEGYDVKKLMLKTPGTLKPAEYDSAIADLTNYLVFMGEPAKLVRHQIGWIVLAFLSILFVLVYALKKEIWKDIH